MVGGRPNSQDHHLILSFHAPYGPIVAGLVGRYARLRNTGKLTVAEVANLLGVSIQTVRRWGKEEIIKTYPYNDRNGCLYEHPGVSSTLMKKMA